MELIDFGLLGNGVIVRSVHPNLWKGLNCSLEESILHKNLKVVNKYTIIERFLVWPREAFGVTI